MPLNRELFAQRGGMAPFGSLDNGYLIDQAARVQAETYPLDQSFGELSSVIPKVGHEAGPAAPSHPVITDAGAVAKSGTQEGGRRRSRSRKQKKQQRKQRQSRRHSRRQRSQKQRGGMFPINGDTMLLGRNVDTGVSSQFSNEAQVNNLYNEYSGPQGHPVHSAPVGGHASGHPGGHAAHPVNNAPAAGGHSGPHGHHARV